MEIKEIEMKIINLLIIGTSRSGKSTLIKTFEKLLQNAEGYEEEKVEGVMPDFRQQDCGLRIYKNEYTFE